MCHRYISLRWHYISGEHWHYTGTRHNWNWGIAIKGISKAMCHWQTSLVYTGELFHCQILANINGFTLANSGSGYIISYHGIRQDQSIGEQLQTLASIGERWGTFGRCTTCCVYGVQVKTGKMKTGGQHWEKLGQHWGTF